MTPKAISNIIDAVLSFWFGDPEDPGYGENREAWFKKDPDFDREIETRFGALIADGAAGRLDSMAESPEGAVALVIILDQFPRNIYRGDARAFAQDAKARAVAERAIAREFDASLMPVMRKFLYLPFEHSEDLADQDLALKLFTPLGAEDLEWAEKHRNIIAEFGRFPHRNAALGRVSTPEEEAFLARPGSSF